MLRASTLIGLILGQRGHGCVLEALELLARELELLLRVSIQNQAFFAALVVWEQRLP